MRFGLQNIWTIKSKLSYAKRQPERALFLASEKGQRPADLNLQEGNGWLVQERFQYILYIGFLPKDSNPHPFLRIDDCSSLNAAAECEGRNRASQKHASRVRLRGIETS
jgi:hypothetical protein